jgi:hypothetical protein
MVCVGKSSGAPSVRLNVEMTLSAKTAQRFREVSQSLMEKDLSDDALLAATVLMRIARNYEIALSKAQAADTAFEEGPRSGSTPE